MIYHNLKQPMHWFDEMEPLGCIDPCDKCGDINYDKDEDIDGVQYYCVTCSNAD